MYEVYRNYEVYESYEIYRVVCTSGKGVILHKKSSRKCRIKIFRLRLCFRENRL